MQTTTNAPNTGRGPSSIKRFARLIRVGGATVLTLAMFVGFASPAAAAPPLTGTMDFNGEITSVKPQGKQCRYTANLEVAVSTSTTGNPEGFTGRVKARWTDDCPEGPTPAYVSGTADVRLNISTTASGTPDGFRFSGKGSNVSTQMGGTPDGVQTTASGTPDGLRFTGFGAETSL